MVEASTNRGSTFCGYSPRVMWARLSSQRTPRSSGNCSRYSVKCWIASREPVGIGVDGGRGDRQDARALAAAHHAILVLAAPQRGDPLEVDEREEADLGEVVVFDDPGARLIEQVVGALGLALEIEDAGLRQQDQEPLGVGLTRGREGHVELIHQPLVDARPVLADVLQRGIDRPAEMLQGRGEGAVSSGEPRRVLEPLPDRRSGAVSDRDGLLGQGVRELARGRLAGTQSAEVAIRDHPEEYETREQDEPGQDSHVGIAKRLFVRPIHGISRQWVGVRRRGGPSARWECRVLFGDIATILSASSASNNAEPPRPPDFRAPRTSARRGVGSGREGAGLGKRV